MNKLPWFLWLVAAAILLMATLKLPYGYYTFTRIAICVFCVAVAYFSMRESAMAWATAFGLVAILFNPIIPVYLSRPIWLWIDLSVAAFFVVHLLTARLGWLRSEGAP